MNVDTCTVPWFGGATVDHLYADCPNYLRGRPEMVHVGWGDVAGDAIDPHGTDVCGLCRHRHNQTVHGGDP